ncbi:hypothetical protein ACFYY2_12330 [Streptomyces sp. NPDC001822]|uniref:hypothetical protein n=1 Tax=Streptomyces sp. NPDC001822 TaxID=3364614 RepID=UPI003679CAEC
MKSIWEPGTRVRVRKSPLEGLSGMAGVIQEVNYAQFEEATSVLLDEGDAALNALGLGAFFYDYELEAE